MELTKSELEIMEIFWKAGVPMSRGDLLSWAGDRNWKDSSIHILMNGLLRKNAIYQVGVVRRSKTYGRTFLPKLSREAYYAANLLSRPNPPKLEELFRELLDRSGITQEERKALLEKLTKE